MKTHVLLMKRNERVEKDKTSKKNTYDMFRNIDPITKEQGRRMINNIFMRNRKTKIENNF